MKTILTEPIGEDDNFHIERSLYGEGYRCVAGTDEVGRGPLAGPVVAACVVLPYGCQHPALVDSKKLTHKKRVSLNQYLRDIGADIGIGIVSERTIERINILQASLLAMKRAVLKLTLSPDYLLVDGKFTVPIDLPQQALIKGEMRSSSIAAASIVAKVARDTIMTKLHVSFPVYNFRQNSGYPTKEHRLAIQNHGIIPSHRRTFKGVKEYV